MSDAFAAVNGPDKAVSISNHPKSIVVVTPWFPNRPGEWVGNFIYSSVAALASRGIAVHVLVCRAYAPAWLVDVAPRWMRGTIDTAAFKELATLEVVRYPHLPRRWLRPIMASFRHRRIGAALKGLALRSRSELIHAHTEELAPIACTVAKELKIPALVTLHGLNTDLLNGATRNGAIFSAMAAADRAILVGESLRSVFGELVGRDDHFRVVPNGVAFAAQKKRSPLLLDNAPVRFISVSNLHEGKGVDITLRALATIWHEGFCSWNYTIVGEGAEYGMLFKLTRSLGLTERVKFLGARPHEEIYDLLGDADVFVLPSYREAFGVAYLEAMAAGLATIGVRGQGPQAFIEHGKTGFLVEPKSARSLADCIRDIMTQRAETRQIAAAGAKFVRDAFTWDAHAERLIEVYRELAS